MQKNRVFMRLFCIITRFWCGRQELKTYDDMKKALIFKAFLLLNANVDAKIIRRLPWRGGDINILPFPLNRPLLRR